MSKPKASSAARRIRRKLARWLAPELEAELRETRAKLKTARSKLRAARGESARALPPEVEETIARARAEHLTYLKRDHLRDLASSCSTSRIAGCRASWSRPAPRAAGRRS